METPAFGELVTHLVESMGLQLESARRGPEGISLRTPDGFLLVFVEDPNELSLETVRRWLGEVEQAPVKLVVLTPKRLPPALEEEVAHARATLVQGGRFSELARGLGLSSYLGEGPPEEPPTKSSGRRLPSAGLLDAIMARARTWLEWGVPALSLRFYRQAAELKPEFAPARVGIGRSLLALGLTEEADRAFDDVLRAHPLDVEARLGHAAVLGASGKPEEEVAVYRQILAEEPKRLDVRANLVAALIAEKNWADARVEIELMLDRTPEDPQIRYLHAAALDRTGAVRDARKERDRARALGLDADRERALAAHLGLPTPEAVPLELSAEPIVVPPSESSPPSPPAKPVGKPRRTARRTGRSVARGKRK